MREPMKYLLLLSLVACGSSHAAAVTIDARSSTGIAPPVASDSALTIEALSSDGIASPVVRHRTLRAEAGASICNATETAWASRLAPHDAIVLCLPTTWNGSGEVDARLAISTPFG
jgi:hypothetical protein